jgi:hypothetical protein
MQSGLDAAQTGALDAVAAAVEAPDFQAGLSRANTICERLLASDRVQRRD